MPIFLRLKSLISWCWFEFFLVIPTLTLSHGARVEKVDVKRWTKVGVSTIRIGWGHRTLFFVVCRSWIKEPTRWKTRSERTGFFCRIVFLCTPWVRRQFRVDTAVTTGHQIKERGHHVIRCDSSRRGTTGPARTCPDLPGPVCSCWDLAGSWRDLPGKRGVRPWTLPLFKKFTASVHWDAAGGNGKRVIWSARRIHQVSFCFPLSVVVVSSTTGSHFFIVASAQTDRDGFSSSLWHTFPNFD